MSEHLHTSLFSESDCLSEQQIYAYIDGKLNAQERHAVEKHMLGCELCADAMEGLSLVKNRKIIDETVALVKEKYPIAIGSKKTENKEPVIIAFNYKRTFAIAASVLLLIGAGFMFIHYSDNAQKDVAMNNEIVKDPQEKNENEKTEPVIPPQKNEQELEKSQEPALESPVSVMDEKKPAPEFKENSGPAETKTEEKDRSKKEVGNFYDWRRDEPKTSTAENQGGERSGNKNINSDADAIKDVSDQAANGAGGATVLRGDDLQRELTADDNKAKTKSNNNAASAPPVVDNTTTTTTETAAADDNSAVAKQDNSGMNDSEKQVLGVDEEARKKTNEDDSKQKTAKEEGESGKPAALAEDKVRVKSLFAKRSEVVIPTGGKKEAFKGETSSSTPQENTNTNITQTIVSGNAQVTISVPQYTEGYDAMQKFIKDNTDLVNCKGCTGTVTLSFTVKANGTIARDIVQRALDMLDVDDQGFDMMDRKLLLALIDKFSGGPVGVDSLAAAISEERGTIEDVIEPFLIQQGFIMRTPRGRIATRHAYLHFGMQVPERVVVQKNLSLLDEVE